MLKAESEATSSDSTKIGTSRSVVKLLRDSLEPVRLHVQCTGTMMGKQEEENASKQCQFSIKRKRKEPPR
jgi:hypothetical protein